MRSRRPRPAGAAVACLALTALAGCSTAPDPPPAADPPPAVSGAFRQTRAQLESGEVPVLLSVPDGAPSLEVGAMSVRPPGFAPGPAREQDHTVGGGQTAALPAAPGRATCAPPAAEDPAVVVVSVPGRPSPVRVRLSDEDGQLDLVADRECEAARARAAVPAAWLPGWSTEGSGADPVAVGVLRLGPVTGRSRATVTGAGPTPLFDHAVEGAPLVLAPGQREDVVVRLRPARCDAHAVAEDEPGFGPLLTVAVDGEQLRGRVRVPPDQRAAPLAALGQRCAAG